MMQICGFNQSPIMRSHDDQSVPRGLDQGQPHQPGRLRIELGRRLVRKDRLGGKQKPSNPDPHSLATGYVRPAFSDEGIESIGQGPVIDQAELAEPHEGFARGSASRGSRRWRRPNCRLAHRHPLTSSHIRPLRSVWRQRDQGSAPRVQQGFEEGSTFQNRSAPKRQRGRPKEDPSVCRRHTG